MEEMLNYTLKASIGLLALYLFYYVLLRRQNSFGFNRLYLLLAPLTAVLLPLLTWPAILSPEAAVQETLQAVRLSEVMVTAYGPASTQASASSFTLTAVLTGLYLTGIVVLLFRLFRQLWQIKKAKAAAIPVVTEEDAAIYQLDSHYPTFAFGNSVFLSRQQEQLSEPEKQQIVAHELAHVNLGHTWDVLFYELLSAVLWFHPAVWLLKQELRDVHEYQADAAVVKEHQTQQYTSLLSKEALLNMGLPVGSHFTKPQVLKRLHMLQRQGQGQKPGWLRPLLVLPLLGGLTFILARQQVSALPASGKGTKANIATTTENTPASTGPAIK
ncbi:MAG: M56 family metallopeptidase, partial [Pontibacter sp.]|nr:M56 family metallopeptidase [Pontibacter sp.]